MFTLLQNQLLSILVLLKLERIVLDSIRKIWNLPKFTWILPSNYSTHSYHRFLSNCLIDFNPRLFLLLFLFRPYEVVSVKGYLPSTGSNASGVIRVTAFNHVTNVPLAERLIFRKHSQQMNIQIQSDKEKYSPGDTVNMRYGDIFI